MGNTESQSNQKIADNFCNALKDACLDKDDNKDYETSVMNKAADPYIKTRNNCLFEYIRGLWNIKMFPSMWDDASGKTIVDFLFRIFALQKLIAASRGKEFVESIKSSIPESE